MGLHCGGVLFDVLDAYTAGTTLMEEEEKFLRLLTRKTKIWAEDVMKRQVGHNNVKYSEAGEPGVRVLKSLIEIKSLGERLRTLDALFGARDLTCESIASGADEQHRLQQLH